MQPIGSVRRSATDLLHEFSRTPPGGRVAARKRASGAVDARPDHVPHFRRVPAPAHPWAEGVYAAIDMRVSELRRQRRLETRLDAATAGPPASPDDASGPRSARDRVAAAREGWHGPRRGGDGHDAPRA